jgi:hypothetical protein
MELTKDKRPPDIMLWDGKPEDIDEWIDKVFNIKKKAEDLPIMVDISEIEG